MGSPYFVAFDLDETLGYFSSPAIHLTMLDPRLYYRDYPQYTPFEPSAELQAHLDGAFQQFIRCLAATEEGKLGFRDGIVPIVKRLLQAKQAGQVKAMAIYSNNGNYSCLKFAKEFLEFLIGEPIFCDLVHFWHPLRAQGNARNMSRPGRATKTFQVLRKIFTGPCGFQEEDVDPNFTLFFDDNIHTNILDAISTRNYFHVNHYKKDIPFPILQTCFLEAIQSQGLDTNKEYLAYCRPFTKKRESSFEDILDYIQQANKTYIAKNLEFVDDTESILSRLNTMFSPLPAPQVNQTSSVSSAPLVPLAPSAPVANQTLPNYGENYFPVVDGGKRKYTKKRKSLGKKQKRKQRKSYRKRAP